MYIACKACKGNFVLPNFRFFFWNCLEKWIHLFLPERFPKFLGLKFFWDFRTMKHCVHRRYPAILIFFFFFFEILLLCYLCKNISYNFTTLVMKSWHRKRLFIEIWHLFTYILHICTYIYICVYMYNIYNLYNIGV